jgi:hypothetical protein
VAALERGFAILADQNMHVAIWGMPDNNFEYQTKYKLFQS